MARVKIQTDVLSAAIDRMVDVYRNGHRVVVSFSAGKDSGVCLEVCLLAARDTGRLPVEVIMRDEEIMYPGTFEYAERVARRPDVDFNWISARQPVVNIFNREQPYFWVFDPLLRPDQWLREPPPDLIEWIPDQNIQAMTIPSRFPPAEGKQLVSVIGLRGQESRNRMMAVHSSRGYLTLPNPHGVIQCRPIYDWMDGDVWRAHNELKWDYNRAYDVMHRMGIPRSRLRIAPPTLNAYGLDTLQVASRAWPQWFDKVCERLPGVRSAALFGRRAVQPHRRLGETWKQCFHRVCIDEAPAWIADRSKMVRDRWLSTHHHHAGEGVTLPEVVGCSQCTSGASISSWKRLTETMYTGDPFSVRVHNVPYVEPEFFRPGAGTWGGKPAF